MIQSEDQNSKVQSSEDLMYSKNGCTVSTGDGKVKNQTCLPKLVKDAEEFQGSLDNDIKFSDLYIYLKRKQRTVY